MFSLQGNKKPARMAACRFVVYKLVELRGFEPLAS